MECKLKLWLVFVTTFSLYFEYETKKQNYYMPNNSVELPVSLQKRVKFDLYHGTTEVDVYGVFNLYIDTNPEQYLSFNTYVDPNRLSECTNENSENYFRFSLVQDDCTINFIHYKDKFEFGFDVEMKSLDRFVESDDVHVQYQANGTLKAWIANNPQLFSFFMPSDQISSDFNGCKFVSDGPQSTTVVRFNVVAEDNSGSCGVRMLFVRPIALIVPMSDYPPQLPRAVNIALRPKDHRKQSIPYSLKVEVKPTMGQFLWFQGKIVSKGSTLVLRFIKGGPEYGVGTESVLLSIEARFEDGHLLLGSLTKWGGKWNDEEFADGCISKFQTDFDMSIRFGERDFEFYCRNELMAYYPYEYTDIPFSEIDYVYANGDIEIYRMRFAGDVFMVPYKSSFNSPHMMTGQRLYIIGVESVRDFVDNYWMYVDFYSEKEIIFRFWVDRKTKKITLNGDHGGTKNLDSFPFNTAGYGDRLRGGGFYLDFLLETDLFRIFVNNQEIGTYEHKVDLNDKRISHFEISGTLIIRSIEIGSISDIDIPEHNES